ncbi:TonB-dependent receptor plug domain-containing protein [Reichenbachiella faecimaris]|nr:TonB-dependent receptor plug domain-containing protein [Reichenbachiella faecimaris]
MALAQKQTQIRIIDALKQLETAHSVSFSYNPKLLENLWVDPMSDFENLKSSLDELSKAAPLRFDNPGSEFYSIIPIRSNVSFEVLDRQTGEAIPVVFAKVGLKDYAYLYPTPVKFELRNAFVTDSIELSSRFYSAQKMTVEDLIESNNQVWLEPDTLYLENVTVMSYTISGINANIEQQSMEIDMSDLGLIAGETDGDILQVLKTIPGIKSPTGKAGALMMRGSTYDQNLMYFDNIPLYHTGHYFGTISPYNQAVVDKVDVHRGSLPAKWSGKVGGLIDIQTKSEIPEKVKGGALANTIYAGGYINSPIVKDKVSLFVSARTNYPEYSSAKMEAYSELNLQGSRVGSIQTGKDNNLDRFDVRFNDLNGKLIYKPNGKNEVTSTLLRISDDFGFTILTPDEDLKETGDSKLFNWGMTTQWTSSLTDQWNTSLSHTYSVFELSQVSVSEQSGNEISNKNAKNSISDNRVSLDMDYKVSEKTDFNFGYSFAQQNVIFDETEVETGMTKDKHTDDEGLTHSAYMSAKRHLGQKFILEGGMHMDHFSVTSELFLDPRFMISCFLTKSFYLKSSAGRSRQYLFRSFLNDFDDFRLGNQFWNLADSNHGVQTGKQYMIGGLFDKSGWLFDLELYIKDTDGLERQVDPRTLETGSLRTIGMDLLLKKRFQAFDLWGSYTLSHAETDFSEIQDAYFDQTHVLNLMLLIPRDRWNLSLAWGLMSGMPVEIPTPRGPGPDQPTTIDTPYDDRFPIQHQLDLSATYQFSKPEAAWKGVVGLSFINLYNKENLINIFQNGVKPDNPYRYGIGFSPNLQLSISW